MKACTLLAVQNLKDIAALQVLGGLFSIKPRSLDLSNDQDEEHNDGNFKEEVGKTSLFNKSFAQPMVLPQAKPILNQGDNVKLVDPRLEGAYNIKQLNRLAFAASLCIRKSSTWRPVMSEVLQVMLMEGEIDKERWKIPKEDEEDESWSLEDLECECDSASSTSVNDE
ncbi:hypothetical protein AG4045_024179 [Apium graveolens]|uniref:Serine-threonine/tyrosine-protein kinase catalytic domain-containing protein n=1 Tax=Apium graveolens TaxID=4045 RepID=A0A6L5BE13_APIGR|nr:hypothetical protein AG4045_024179 [Apium graveolens]